MTDLGQIFIFIIAFFGLFFGMTILLVILVNRSDKGKKGVEQTEQAEVKEKIIIKEVVMIPCQYCGALAPKQPNFARTVERPTKKQTIERYFYSMEKKGISRFFLYLLKTR